MRRFRIPVPLADMWRPSITAVVSLVFVAALATFRLGTITPGFSAPEIEQRTATRSADAIIDNPLFLKQKAGQFLVQKSGHKGPVAMRLWSALFGVLFAACMFIILKNWHTTRIAFLGTFLFATSSWFLHTIRLATHDVAFLMPMLLIVGGIWLHAKRHMVPAALIVVFAAVLMLYVPAMILIVLPAIVWQRRVLKKTLQALSVWWQAVIIVAAVVGLAPLVWALTQNSDLILTWLGLPPSWPEPVTYLRNLADIPFRIFVKGVGDPLYGIGNLPLLDIFTSVMVILGAFAYVFRLRLDRTRLLMSVGFAGILLIALDGPVRVSFLLPFVYLLAAAGVTLLLQQWFTVFPRNPFARALGVTMITLSVGLVGFYHLNRYFVAWPNVPETKATFRHQP